MVHYGFRWIVVVSKTSLTVYLGPVRVVEGLTSSSELSEVDSVSVSPVAKKRDIRKHVGLVRSQIVILPYYMKTGVITTDENYTIV